MSICVIIPCSKTKNKGSLKAILKYNGAIYKQLPKLRKIWKFDLYIFSAKYGIINEFMVINDYEFTFNGMPKNKIQSIGNELKVSEEINKLCDKYDNVIISVGKNYQFAITGSLKINATILKRQEKDNRKGCILSPIVALYDYLKENNDVLFKKKN